MQLISYTTKNTRTKLESGVLAILNPTKEKVIDLSSYLICYIH